LPWTGFDEFAAAVVVSAKVSGTDANQAPLYLKSSLAIGHTGELGQTVRVVVRISIIYTSTAATARPTASGGLRSLTIALLFSRQPLMEDRKCANLTI